MKLFKKISLLLFIGLLVFMIVPKSYGAPINRPRPPVLVIDRCPEFCQGFKPPVQMCTQALIPVPGKPGYWYTDGCKKNIIKMGRR